MSDSAFATTCGTRNGHGVPLTVRSGVHPGRKGSAIFLVTASGVVNVEVTRTSCRGGKAQKENFNEVNS